jgi:hypothetical protein
MSNVIAIGNSSASFCTGFTCDISNSIIIGQNAQATGRNQFVLGSSTIPLSTAPGSALGSANCFLVANINGSCVKIPLFNFP